MDAVPEPCPVVSPAVRNARPQRPRALDRETVKQYPSSVATHMSCLLWKHALWMRRNLM